MKQPTLGSMMVKDKTRQVGVRCESNLHSV